MGSEMCIRDRHWPLPPRAAPLAPQPTLPASAVAWLSCSAKLRQLDTLLDTLKRAAAGQSAAVLIFAPLPAMALIERLLSLRRLAVLGASRSTHDKSSLVVALIPVGDRAFSLAPPALSAMAAIFYDCLDSPLRQLLRLGTLTKMPRVYYLVHGDARPCARADAPPRRGFEEEVLRLHLRAAAYAPTAEALIEQMPVPARLTRALAACS